MAFSPSQLFGYNTEVDNTSYLQAAQPQLAPRTPEGGEVVGAVIEEMYTGNNTAAEFSDSWATRPYQGREWIGGKVNQYRQDPRTPIDEESWKESKYYREGINYFQGMTEEAAEVFATRHDEQAHRDSIMARATTGQKAFAYPVGFAAGLFEPLNVASALVLPELGVVRMAGLAGKLGKLSTRAIEGAANGALGNLALEPLAITANQRLQEEYGMVDILMNTAVGAGAGSILKPLGGALADRYAVRPDVDYAAKQAAIYQMAEGKPVTVEPLVRKFDDVFDPRRWDTELDERPLNERGEININFGEARGIGRAEKYDIIGDLDAEEILDIRLAAEEYTTGRSSELLILDNEFAPGQTVQKIEGDTPEWVKRYNEQATYEQQEAKRVRDANMRRFDNEKQEVPEASPILTRKDVDKVTQKLIRGTALGKRERKIAEAILTRAQEVKMDRLAYRDEQARTSMKADKALGARMADDEEMQRLMDDYTKVESYQDAEPYRGDVDEVAGERSADEELQLLDQEIANAEKAGLIDENDLDEYREVGELVRDAKFMEKAYDAASVCMGRYF